MRTKFSGILTLLLAFVVQITFAQEKTVSGTVTDDQGLPLPGVNIIIKGTSSGTQTDFDGNYNLETSNGSTLVFSYIGFETQEITIGAASSYNITMEAGNTLDEVVVTALGIKRKKDQITTAYEVVDSESLNKANNPDVFQGLAGKVTGLQITKTNSGVNSSNRIILRGNRSISGDNQALIVVDGAISNANFLQSIDPNTIESVNVIKGANGSALYGQQGSNGVIVVTTRKGTDTGKMIVNVKSTIDFETVAFVPEQQTRYGQGWDYGNGPELITYENGAWGPEFDGQMANIGLPQADGTYITAPYSSRGGDHIKDFFQTGTTYQNGVTISSGDEEGYSFFSAQNQRTEFVIKNDKLNKSTFNYKGGKTLGKWRIGGNATYSYTATEESYARDFNNSIFRQLVQTPTNVPIEAFANSGNEGHWNGYYLNPYWVRDNKRRNIDSNRFNLLGEIEYSFNDNIQALIRTNGLFNYNNNQSYGNEYKEPLSVQAITNNGENRNQSSYYSTYNSQYQKYYTDAIVSFSYPDLVDDFTFDANIGLNNQYEKVTQVNVGGSGLTVPNLYSTTNLSGEFDKNYTGDSRSSSRRYGVYGNLDIGYKDFLFLNVTGRNDWSSVLAKENNSFFYPSAGLSFIPTKAFPSLKGDVLNYAKITASVVKVGSDGQIQPYRINSLYTQGYGFPYGGNNSFVLPLSQTDPALEPEFTSSQEVGLNLGFFNDRVTFDGTYYQFTTDNQITTISTPASSGLSSATVNLAETEGWGTELDLGIVPIRTDDFQWNVNFGFTKNYTEVVSVTDETNEVRIGGNNASGIFAIAGEQFPTLKTTGYARDDQGRVIVDPLTGNPETASDLQVQGNTTPDYILNLNTSLTYKGLTLSATMDYRTGHVFYSQSYSGYLFSGQTVESAQGGRTAFIFPNSAIPNPDGDGYIANTSVPTAGSGIEFSDYYGSSAVSGVAENSVFDATAFKLRELSLRYDINKDLLENTLLTGVSISAVARNLFILFPEENRGYNDPETNFSNGSNAIGIASLDQYPTTRSFGFGINLTF
ncbi:SusC/RagA family TonB-linked outer membrane protein [Mesonia ostreae]|uniref:SusC/RagA family TonB-linked outer membrane protein n=1 Tax=Mesonia ostreae TaxID=861110 RepID=A0ABU2KLF6_9FLAO|nr:SusC/RagA family TonB-linked outer membrane protein [Mesonia ostreae]MDT0295528.1 SusC/RagA family TonB-linked outer membrane protein [Mesonia ostreae]